MDVTKKAYFRQKKRKKAWGIKLGVVKLRGTGYRMPTIGRGIMCEWVGRQLDNGC